MGNAYATIRISTRRKIRKTFFPIWTIKTGTHRKIKDRIRKKKKRGTCTKMKKGTRKKMKNRTRIKVGRKMPEFAENWLENVQELAENWLENRRKIAGIRNPSLPFNIRGVPPTLAEFWLGLMAANFPLKLTFRAKI